MCSATCSRAARERAVALRHLRLIPCEADGAMIEAERCRFGPLHPLVQLSDYRKICLDQPMSCVPADSILASGLARAKRQSTIVWTWELEMAWKTPKIVEVPVGMEINMYACAARK